MGLSRPGGLAVAKTFVILTVKHAGGRVEQRAIGATVIPQQIVSVQSKPLPCTEIVAAMREAICEDCEHNSDGTCRLNACCQKSISENVKWALSKCPIGKWGITHEHKP